MDQPNKDFTYESKSNLAVKRKRLHFIVGPIVLLYCFALTLSFAVTALYAPYIISKTLYPHRKLESSTGSICDTNHSSTTSQESTVIQKQAASFSIYTSLLTSLPAAFSSVILGTLSDQLGRKFSFLISFTGQLLSKGLMATFIYLETNVYLLLIGSAIEGLTGGFLFVLHASFTYIADITKDDKERSVFITLTEMCLGVGVVLSKVTAGYFIKATHYFYPMLTVACIFCLLNLVVLFILPETQERKKDKNSHKFSFLLKYTKNAFSFYVAKNDNGTRWKYVTFLLIFGFYALTMTGDTSVLTLYQISQPFCWGSVKVGWYGTIKYFLQSILCLAMIKVFHRCMKDEGVAILGSTSAVFYCLITALARNDVMMYIAPIVGFGAILPFPMIRAIMSRMTSKHKQGSLFGGLSAVEILGNLAGNALFNTVYSHTVDLYKGAVYFVMFACAMISLVMLSVTAFISKTTTISVYELEIRQDEKKYGTYTSSESRSTSSN
ncbi:lysosomal proton-coupled steroid conjugate and bile acid symporter SLC46A3-like [Saccostrea echinata]|uniref:lysosomal proton-coupled steroid conjugate and bile acid symporter SLC46A3-like n=1 Tax=Saccostrea echinata TaxID=191078 RepID=UPI002A826406|nr:lysosomal proton-coupled steroid conjugate and bile acid symporter SLC46A3-like [Saccostrea echinata]